MSNEAPLSRDRTAGILRPCLFGKLSHLNRSTSSCTDFPSSARSYFDIFDLQEILKVRCELMAWTQSIHQPERRTLEEESDLLYMTVLICINADEQVSHLTNVPLGIPCVHIQSLANQKVPKPYTMPYFLHCWALLVVLDRKNCFLKPESLDHLGPWIPNRDSLLLNRGLIMDSLGRGPTVSNPTMTLVYPCIDARFGKDLKGRTVALRMPLQNTGDWPFAVIWVTQNTQWMLLGRHSHHYKLRPYCLCKTLTSWILFATGFFWISHAFANWPCCFSCVERWILLRRKQSIKTKYQNQVFFTDL